MPIQDTDLMPWGKHKGIKMANVPSSYLLWLLENNKCSGDVKQYIEDNLEVLQFQRANNDKKS
jgi:uncharacterized protein (DUF3820 family)